MFSTYYYKGVTVEGSCSDWQTFIDGQLLLPYDFMQYSELSATFKSYNYDTTVGSSFDTTCRDVVVINGIVDSLKYGTVYTGLCDGNTWRSFTCDQGRVLCVNCKLNCLKTVSCPATSYTFSSCQNCRSRAAAYAILRMEYIVVDLSPQFNGELTAVAYQSSILIAANITKPGNVYCAAVMAPQAIFSTASIRDSGYQSYVLSSGVVYISIVNLYADTDYTVYCYAEDFAGHSMNFTVVQNKILHVRTACCRSLAFTISPRSIQQYVPGTVNPEQQLFYVALSSPPVGDVVLLLSINTTICPGEAVASDKASLPAIFPKSLPFSPLSTSLQQAFQVQSTFTGCYVITASMKRTATDFYFPASTSVSVTGSRSAPYPPILNTASFNPDGTQLIFTFDSPTNLAATKISTYSASFSCSLIVSFSSNTISVCKWKSSLQLLADLPISNSLSNSATKLPNVGDKVYLLANKITAACVPNTGDCSLYKFAPRGSLVNLTVPIDAIAPTVLISAPTTIDACDSIFIDPSRSTGSGGRRWNSVQWSLTGATLSPSIDPIYLAGQINLLRAYLTEYFIDMTQTQEIPNDYIMPSVAYTLTLRLTNFLLKSSAASATVTVASKGIKTPQVRILGITTLYRWKSTSFFAKATLPACIKNVSVSNFKYNWILYNGLVVVNTGQSVSADPRYFILSPYTLDTSKSYSIRVIVTLQSQSNTNVITSSDNIFVQVIKSNPGIIAIVSGGLSQSVSSTEAFTLDASASYDVDYPTSSNLTYAWSCVTQRPLFGLSCTNFLAGEAAAVVVAHGLPAGTFNFTVIVSNSYSQISSTSTVVTVINGTIPKITIDKVQQKYNTDQQIQLTGRLLLSNSYAIANWSSITASLSNGNFLTPRTRVFPVGYNTFQLAICANCLTAGVIYNFQLTAGYISSNRSNSVDGPIAFATVAIIMNSPPHGGVLSIAPTRGTALSDVFQLATYYWVDDSSDLPLSYVFSSIADSVTTSILQPINEVSTSSVYLGQGLKENGYSVQCIATAYDIYGATSSTTASVSVFPPNSVSNAISSANSILAIAFSSKNAALAAQALSAAVASVNNVDCTVPIACSSLKRNLCSTTAQTCGSCLNGYVGVSGNSNTPCYDPALVVTVGGLCSSNSSCITGVCKTGVCANVNKVCPSSCNGHGVCTFLDNNGFNVATCSILQPYCQAVCKCFNGWFGSDCSMNYKQYTTAISYRESLCASMSKSFALQDVTINVLSSRASLISSILVDSSQVSDLAVDYCGAALVQTVLAYSSLICQQPSVLSTVVTALSSVLDKQSLSSAFRNQIVNATSFLSFTCQSTVAVGAPPLQLISKNVRTSIASADSYSLSSTTFSSVQSTLEKFSAKPSTSINLNSLSSSTGSFGVTITEFTSVNMSRTSSQATSSAPQLQVVQVDSKSGRRRLLSQVSLGVKVSIPNIAPVKYGNVLPEKIRIMCSTVRTKQYNVIGTCKNGYSTMLACPAMALGFFNFTCPNAVVSPVCQCTSLSASGTPLQVSTCTATRYDSLSTTCDCNTNKGGSQRRLGAAISATTSYQFQTSITTIAYDYSYKYTTTKSIGKAVNYDITILSSLAGLIALFLCVFIVLTAVDSKDSSFLKRLVHDKEAAHKLKESTVRKYVVGDDKPKLRTSYEFFTALCPDLLLASGRWYQIIWSRAKEEHILLKVFFTSSTSKEGVSHQKLFWLMFVSKLLCNLCVITVLAKLFFADDGYCNELTTQGTCNNAHLNGIWIQSCYWDDSINFCNFSSQSLTFPLLLFFALLTSIVCIPLCWFCEHLLRSIANFKPIWKATTPIHTETDQPNDTTDEAKNVEDRTTPNEQYYESEFAASEFTIDEFRSFQSTKSKFIRAARLDKIRRNMEFLSPAEEAQLLTRRLRSEVKILSAHESLLTFIDRNRVRLLRYGFQSERDVKLDALTRRIVAARNTADDLKRQSERFHFNSEKEIFLMKHFIVDLFTGYMRAAAREHFFGDVESLHDSHGSSFNVFNRIADILGEQVLQVLTIATAAFILLGMAVVIYLFSTSIGSKAIPFWGNLTLFCLGTDIFLVQTMKIYLKNIILIAPLRKAVPLLCETLGKKVRFMMTHNSGMMKGALSLVQHFNPSCRVARMYPGLPISRYLLSVNDNDIPLLHRTEGNGAKSGIALVFGYFQFVLDRFSELSHTTQALSLEFIFMSILILVAFILYEIGSVAPAAGWALFVMLLLSPFGVEAHYRIKVYLKSLEKADFNDFSFITKKGDIQMKPEKQNPPDIMMLASAIESKDDLDAVAMDGQLQGDTDEDRISIELFDSFIMNHNNQMNLSPPRSSKSLRWMNDSKSPDLALSPVETNIDGYNSDHTQQLMIGNALSDSILEVGSGESNALLPEHSLDVLEDIEDAEDEDDQEEEEGDEDMDDQYSGDEYDVNDAAPLPTIREHEPTSARRSNRFDDESTISSLGSRSVLWQHSNPPPLSSQDPLAMIVDTMTSANLESTEASQFDDLPSSRGDALRNYDSGRYNSLSNKFKQSRQGNLTSFVSEEVLDTGMVSRADEDNDEIDDLDEVNALVVTIKKDPNTKNIAAVNEWSSFIFTDDMERSVRSLPSRGEEQRPVTSFVPGHELDRSGLLIKKPDAATIHTSHIPWTPAPQLLDIYGDAAGDIVQAPPQLNTPHAKRPHTSPAEFNPMPISLYAASDSRPFTSPGEVGTLEEEDTWSVFDEDKAIAEETVRTITEQKRLRKAAEVKAARAASFQYRKYAGRQRQRMQQGEPPPSLRSPSWMATGPGNDVRELAHATLLRKKLLQNLLTSPKEAPVPILVDYLGTGQVLTTTDIETALSAPIRLRQPQPTSSLSPREELPPPPLRMENSKGPARILFSEEFSIAENAQASREKFPMFRLMSDDTSTDQGADEMAKNWTSF